MFSFVLLSVNEGSVSIPLTLESIVVLRAAQHDNGCVN